MEILLNLLKTNADWDVAAVRIILGVVLFAHGAQKLLGWCGGPGFRTTVKMLTTYAKLPPARAVLVIFTEFLWRPRTDRRPLQSFGCNRMQWSCLVLSRPFIIPTAYS